MDLARKATGVDNIHSGININGKTHSYTGKGVILGMMDTGFEANHLNFFKYNADGTKGKSRIQRLWHYKSVFASQVDSYTNATIGNFSFDTREESHATHVAGIMTGSYMGNGDYAYTDKPDLSGGLGQLKGQPIPYYGVAPAADLAFSVGGLYDDNILDGVQRIVDYAESMGKTPVINLSLGNNLGPHDGTDTYTRSLNDLGKYAIICMSSGNEGELKMSAEKTLASGDLTLRTFLSPRADIYTAAGMTPAIDGTLDIWSSDNQPITVQLVSYRISDGSTTNIISSASTITSFTAGGAISSGRGTLTKGVDKNSNRYYVRIAPSYGNSLKINSSYRLAIHVTGKAGQRINIWYGSQGELSAEGVDGYTEGSASGSINANCIGDNIISVGSFNTRQYFGILDDQRAFSTGCGNTGEISSFSSWGIMPDGSTLPNVLAPGSTIISSYSAYSMGYAALASQMTGKVTNGSDTYYWGFMDGTSMSSPFAAGVIALWLEADPTLTVADVKEIIAHTSATDEFTEANPAASGAGKIDAEAGLRYILSDLSAIGSVRDDDDSRLLITPSADGYDITLGGEADFTVNLYDLQGRLSASAQGTDCNASIVTSGLAKGVYVVEISGASKRLTRKITVK